MPCLIASIGILRGAQSVTSTRKDGDLDELIERELIERSILLLRDDRVILDADLARLYGVSTKRLNEQVRRNRKRFPSDFMFQLSREESDVLRSHFATLKLRPVLSL